MKDKGAIHPGSGYPVNSFKHAKWLTRQPTPPSRPPATFIWDRHTQGYYMPLQLDAAAAVPEE